MALGMAAKAITSWKNLSKKLFMKVQRGSQNDEKVTQDGNGTWYGSIAITSWKNLSKKLFTKAQVCHVNPRQEHLETTLCMYITLPAA